jgi:hypothetical protein
MSLNKIPVIVSALLHFDAETYFIFIIPFCRLSNTCDSFIPSTIRQWNSLDPSLRNMESIANFKTELTKRKILDNGLINLLLQM